MPKNNETEKVNQLVDFSNKDAQGTGNKSNRENFKPEDISSLAVSVRTARYIYLKDSLYDLYNELYEVLEKDYDSTTAEKLFEKNFKQSLDQIEKEIDGFLLSSIVENMSYAKRTEII